MPNLKNSIVLKIAGFNIELIFHQCEIAFYYQKLKSEVIKYYGGFISYKNIFKIDAVIQIKDNPIFSIARKPSNNYFVNIFTKTNLLLINTTYKISIIELQYILKELLMVLLKRNGFLFHGSAVLDRGEALIFTGKSGAGKSTTSNLLKNTHETLIDDLMIIKRENNKFYLYKTPLFEKNYKIKKNSTKYLIKKIFFLKKSTIFKTEKLDNKHTIVELAISQLWSEKEYVKHYLKNIMNLVAKNDFFYYLYFAKNKSKLSKLIYDI